MRKRNSLALMWQVMKGNRAMYLFAMLLMGLGAILAYLPPLIIRVSIDSIIGTEAFSTHPFIGEFFEGIGRDYLRERLWLPGLALIMTAIVQGICIFLSGFLAAKASETSVRQMRDRLFRHLQSLPAAYHARSEKGDLLQRCTSDVDTVRRFLALQLVQVGNAIFLVSASLFVTFSIDVELALVAFPIIPIVIVSSILFFGKIQSSFRRSDEAEAALTTLVQEHLTGIRVVRAFGRETHELSRFRDLNGNYRRVTMKLIYWFSSYWASTDILSLTQVAAVIGVGTLWAVAGSVTLGTLLLFISSVWMVLWPVRMMGRILVDMGKAFVAMDRIQQILDEAEEDIHEDGLASAIRGEIEFRNVSFSYDGQNKILEDLSFHIPAGYKVGILGHTGSGKTSLAAMIAGLYKAQEGEVLIDGKPIDEYKLSELRKQVALVLQEPFLFGRSIRRNIGIGNAAHSSSDEVYGAAKDASIHDSIIDFEQGYDTPVGERGVTLSGGQKQRVAIARALLAEAPIMIFDDSLSALDTETDRAVQNAIQKRGQGRTVILISHRVSSLAGTDLVLVMRHGRLLESGSPSELLKQDGLFRRLWELQTQRDSRNKHRAVGE